MSIRIKKAQFFYDRVFEEPPAFQRTFDTINGYGETTLNFSNQLITGLIYDPTGLVPAVFYQTGLLTGTILENEGSFNWNDVTLTGSGQANRVFLDYATGYKQATGAIQIDAFYQAKLTNLDSITINDIKFTFVTGSPETLFEFNTIEQFVETLNLGSQGFYNNEDLETIVGISGYINYTFPYNTIHLTSVSRSGEDGNSNILYRDCNNIDLIRIPSRYFTGGESFRPKINSWVGTFSNTFDTITKENSNFYSFEYREITTSTVKDVSWEDNFNQNYYITTGIRNPNSQERFSGSLLSFDPLSNKYQASVTLPSGNSLFVYTGFKFNISKPNPYNIQGNLAKYIISGEDFIFSGIIEG